MEFNKDIGKGHDLAPQKLTALAEVSVVKSKLSEWSAHAVAVSDDDFILGCLTVAASISIICLCFMHLVLN